MISNRTARRQKQHHDMLYGIGHDMKRGGDGKKNKDNNPIHQEKKKGRERTLEVHKKVISRKNAHEAYHLHCRGEKKSSREPKMRH